MKDYCRSCGVELYQSTGSNHNFCQDCFDQRIRQVENNDVPLGIIEGKLMKHLNIMNELEEEKKALEARILLNDQKIRECKSAINWDKKKLKIVNQQIEATKQWPAEVLQDISKGLK